MHLRNPAKSGMHIGDKALVVVMRNNKTVFLQEKEDFDVKRFSLAKFAEHGAIHVYVKLKGFVWQEFGWKCQPKGTIHRRPRFKTVKDDCVVGNMLKMYSTVGDYV